jgi:hypothetical protein
MLYFTDYLRASLCPIFIGENSLATAHGMLYIMELEGTGMGVNKRTSLDMAYVRSLPSDVGAIVHDPICPIPAAIKVQLCVLLDDINVPTLLYIFQDVIEYTKYKAVPEAALVQESIRRYGHGHGN